MIETFLAAYKAASLGLRIAVVVVPILVLGGAYAIWHHEVYQSGVNDTIAGIARADARLVDRALKARQKLKECQVKERAWDQATGACR